MTTIKFSAKKGNVTTFCELSINTMVLLLTIAATSAIFTQYAGTATAGALVVRVISGVFA